MTPSVPATALWVAGMTLAACVPRGEGPRPGSSRPAAQGTATAGADVNPDTPVSAPATIASTAALADSAAAIDFGVLGRVVNAAGRPIAGVSIGAQALDAQSGPMPEIGVVTNEDGDFHWPLRPGHYRLTPYLEGAPFEPQEVRVEPGKATRVLFTRRTP